MKVGTKASVGNKERVPFEIWVATLFPSASHVPASLIAMQHSIDTPPPVMAPPDIKSRAGKL